MSKTWTFVGGMLAGAASVFAAAAVVVKLEGRTSGNSDIKEKKEKLPVSDAKSIHLIRRLTVPLLPILSYLFTQKKRDKGGINLKIKKPL